MNDERILRNLEEIGQKTEEIGKKTAEIGKKTAEIKEEMQYLRTSVAKLEWENCYCKVNPWLDMSNTTRTRVKNLRDKFFDSLQLTNETAQCWLTGNIGSVKLAHIIPDSASNFVLHKLGLRQDFIDNLDFIRPLNFMILDSDVEEAFDRLEISFIMRDRLHTNEFILKIWNDTVRSGPLGQYEGFVLKVPVQVSLSKRALAYQAFMAYIHNKRKYPDDTPMDEPVDFSSEYEGRDEYRKYLVSMLRSSIREELLEEEDSD